MFGRSGKLKKWIPSLLILLALADASPVFPGELTDPEIQFRNVVDGILVHSCLRKDNFGIKIYSLDRQEALYSVRSDHLFTPASNLKLITTAVAVKYLGPDYRFYTRLYSTGHIEDNILHGDLYIKGFGDPKLVSEQMWLLSKELWNLPLRKVEGDIIADSHYFDSNRHIKSWKSEGAEAYKAPLGALSFNFNTVTVHVMPGKKTGDKPIVVVDPDVDYIRVDNRARTVTKRGRGRLIVNRVERDTYNEITVSGVIAKNQARSRYYLNITDPTRYAASVFKLYLKQNGMEVTGTIKKGEISPEAELLVSHESEPLSLILRGLNKYSNNFVAEQILKTLAVKRFGPPGTTEDGLKIVEEYMASLGIEPGQYQIVDGSGLSRQNRLSPDQIVKVLGTMRSDLGVYPEFITALGVMGLDGNVKGRLNGIDEAQKVRVKTGTLHFVSSLSGYFQSMDGELFAFSILMNDLKCRNGRALEIQDRIIREGLHFRRGDSAEINEEQDSADAGR